MTLHKAFETYSLPKLIKYHEQMDVWCAGQRAMIYEITVNTHSEDLAQS